MKLSIIIPVYRETLRICPRVDQLLGLELPRDVEIIIVDGEPGAPTLSHLKRSRSLPPFVIPVESEKGRGVQMNAGAAKASGDLLFFLHVDTVLDQTAIDRMAQRFSSLASTKDKTFHRFCGAFDLHINSGKQIFRVIEKAASLRSRLSRIPYGDQGIFMSKALFDAIGGFPDVPIMEDVGIMKKIKAKRIRPIFLDHALSTSARRWEQEGVVYTTVRNWILICLYALGADPRLLARFYSSSRV